MAERNLHAALVIGFGNSWRGDDGLGPEVARRIDVLRLPNVAALAVHQLTPELAPILSAVGRAVFVDACMEQGPAPIVVEPIFAGESQWHWSHVCHPRTLLTLSRSLYGHAPEAWMVSVKGSEFGDGQQLSAQAALLAQEAARCVESLLRCAGCQEGEDIAFTGLNKPAQRQHSGAAAKRRPGFAAG